MYHLNEYFFSVGAITESEPRPTGVQLKFKQSGQNSDSVNRDWVNR